jgi:hypothetical protein
MKISIYRALFSVAAIFSLLNEATADTPIITKSKTISVAPTVDTSAYASGDLVGPKQTLTGAGFAGVYTGTIHSVTITDLENQNADFDLVIFSTDPTGTTFTDNVAFDIADADLPKVICVIQVTTNVAFADNGVVIANGNNCVFDATASTGTLYAAPVIRSAGTFTASGLTFRYSILQD